MYKNLIVKIIALLVILVGGQSVFWFFKTSAAKKHVMAVVNSSEGNIAVSKVSVAGFPLSQKISIDDIKFQADSVADKIYLPNKYQVNIKHLDITGSVFSNEFKIHIVGQVSLQDVSGNVGYVEFKQEPSISFNSVKGKIQKLLYQDAGYKIVDEAKNVLYEGGNSVVEFTSSDAGGNKTISNVKADFNDLEGLDGFTTKKIISLINPAVATDDDSLKPVTTSDNTANPSPIANAPAPANPAASKDATNVVPAAPPVVSADKGVAKKAIHLEVEYVMVPKSDVAEKAPAPAAANAQGESELSSVNVKKLEFSSPLYKIDINGNFTSAAPSSNSAIASCDMVVKVEKIDNILTYVKSALASSKILPTAVTATPLATPAVTTPTAAVSAPLSQNATATDIAKAQQPQVDISLAIMDLAKKNTNTKDDLAVFEIKKEKDNDFMVNGTPLIELAKIFPAFAGDIINENY